MITELDFIRTYNNFWRTLFPGADDYIRLINSGLVERFEKPIKVEDIASRRALINNIAFSIFEKYVTQKDSTALIDSLSGDSEMVITLSEVEIEKLSRFRFAENVTSLLSVDELNVAKAISQRLIKKYVDKPMLLIRPIFPGCGLIFESEGDILFENNLIEIKAGQRSFSVQDLRQLFVYLALNHQAKKFEIKFVELCNPRTGLFWRDSVSVISQNISGASSVEIFNDIINFISNSNRSL